MRPSALGVLSIASLVLLVPPLVTPMSHPTSLAGSSRMMIGRPSVSCHDNPRFDLKERTINHVWLHSTGNFGLLVRNFLGVPERVLRPGPQRHLEGMFVTLRSLDGAPVDSNHASRMQRKFQEVIMRVGCLGTQVAWASAHGGHTSRAEWRRKALLFPFPPLGNDTDFDYLWKAFEVHAYAVLISSQTPLN